MKVDQSFVFAKAPSNRCTKYIYAAVEGQYCSILEQSDKNTCKMMLGPISALQAKVDVVRRTMVMPFSCIASHGQNYTQRSTFSAHTTAGRWHNTDVDIPSTTSQPEP